MDEGRELCVMWQSLLKNYTPLFRRGGWVRFVQWVTALVQCGEGHTITQGLMAIDLESRWRVLEHFAEYGSFDRQAVERQTMRMVEQEHPSHWAPWKCFAKSMPDCIIPWSWKERAALADALADGDDAWPPRRITLPSSTCEGCFGTTARGSRSSWFAWKRLQNLPRHVFSQENPPRGPRRLLETTD